MRTTKKLYQWDTDQKLFDCDGKYVDYLTVQPMEPKHVDSRSGGNRPLCINTLDYAVKAAMCDGKGAAWTADEQAAARERIGIPGDYELIASVELTEDVALVDIREDINGESLNLQSCVVRAETPICDSNRNMWFTAFPHLNSTNVDVIRYNATVLRTIENIVLCKFNERGLVIPYLTSYGGVQQANVLPSYTANYIIKRISFSGAVGNYIPVGTKFDVYGVRA